MGKAVGKGQDQESDGEPMDFSSIEVSDGLVGKRVWYMYTPQVPYI